MKPPTRDSIHRTALLGAHTDAHSTIEAALAAHAETGIAIVADATTCKPVTGQAALLAAVATAARAFGTVTVVADPALTFTAGPYRQQTLRDVAAAEQVQLAGDLSDIPPNQPVLLLGSPPPGLANALLNRTPVLQAGWTGWTGRVRRVGRQLKPVDTTGNILAAILAAALGVHEAFGVLQNRPGTDAGYRNVSLNLWHPGNDNADGPPLTHAPAGWWLVGLGHLGQAYAWTISWLNYLQPSTISIVLQDTEKTVDANHSTGMLTPPNPGPIRKTRIVAAVLDRVGYDTFIIERSLGTNTPVTDADLHVALLGVDNLPARRAISAVGWQLAIDTGLGAGPDDFNAILLRRFPGSRTSDQIPGWADPTTTSHRPPNTPAFNDLGQRDPCGVVELAGTAVGAAFVGVTAACLAITEAIREMLGGTGYEAIGLHLQTIDLATASATLTTAAIPARLAPAD